MNESHDTTELDCLECGGKFVPARDWQKFCRRRGNKCRTDYNNREKLCGIKLPAFLREQLEDLANSQDKTVSQMAAEIMHNVLNPGQAPLEDSDIWGKDTL